MREVPQVSPGRHGLFTAREALAGGWTYASLAWAVRSGALVRYDRGIFGVPIAGSRPEDDRARFAARSVAAVLATAPALASSLSAAVLAGLPTWTIPTRACVTVPPRYTGDARQAHLHRAQLWTPDVLRTDVGRTRSARTVIDAAREHGVEEAVVVGDAALNGGLTTLDELAAAGERCAMWPGSRHIGPALAALDRRSESPLESVSRLRIIAMGLPAPELQVNIFDLHGVFIGRADLYWDEFGVVGEVDGLAKYRDDPFGRSLKQRHRNERMAELNLSVIHWGRGDLEDMPYLATRLTDLFADGARRPLSHRRWIAVPADPFAPRFTA